VNSKLPTAASTDPALNAPRRRQTIGIGSSNLAAESCPRVALTHGLVGSGRDFSVFGGLGPR